MLHIYYDIIVPLNYWFDMSQLNLPLAPKDPLLWPIEISLKHIKFWTCIVLVSLHMTWEPPTKLDWMKRLHWLTTISRCSRSRSSPGHSSGPDHIHSRRCSAWFAWHFFNLLQKKVIMSDGSEGLGHFERAGLSEYLKRPLYPFLWHQSLWPNNRLKRWNTAEGSRILDDLCHRYVKK